MNPPERIYVLDTETTGLNGTRYGDLVVEIGIVSVCFETREIREEYSEVVGYDTSKWNREKRNAWIFENTDLTAEDVKNARPLSEIVPEVQNLLRGKAATSYNTAFDFGRYLDWAPWSLPCTVAPCIMRSAHAAVGGDIAFDDGSTTWPRLEKSYAVLCPEDPAHIGAQTHRALSDAVQAAHVMLALSDRGLYDAGILRVQRRRDIAEADQ